MPTTAPGRRQRQVGSGTPRQARSPPKRTAPPGVFGVRHRMRQGPLPLGPTSKRLDADPRLLSTEHATLPPTASDALRCATWPGVARIWFVMTMTCPNRHGSRRYPCPVTFAFLLIQRRPTNSNIPVPHPLSTLRSPAVMHKTAGQGRGESRCKYLVLFQVLACRPRHAGIDQVTDGTTTTPRAVVATIGSFSSSAADSPPAGLLRVITRTSKLISRLREPTRTRVASISMQSPARTGARNCTSLYEANRPSSPSVRMHISVATSPNAAREYAPSTRLPP